MVIIFGSFPSHEFSDSEFDIILNVTGHYFQYCTMIIVNHDLKLMNPINHDIFQEPGYHPQVEAISPTPDDRTAERDDVRSFFYDHDDDEELFYDPDDDDDDHGDHI